MCSSFDWIIEIILFVVYMKTDADYCIKNSIGLNCNHNCNYNDCSDGIYSQVYQKKHVQDSDKMNPTVLCSASSKYFFHLCHSRRGYLIYITVQYLTVHLCNDMSSFLANTTYYLGGILGFVKKIAWIYSLWWKA